MKRLRSIVGAALVVLIGAVFIAPALPASAQSSASLSIVPKKNYTIEPGKSVKDKLSIRNMDAEKPLELTLRVVDFTFKEDGGTPKLMLEENAPQTTWSLKPFLTVPKTITVPPKSSKTVDMNVAVPANQGAGSYYSAIIYSSGAPDGGNVGLSASGVTLVFASVPGKVNENLKLDKFGAYNLATKDKKADYTFLTAEEPLNMGYTLKNEGNVTEAPIGSITLKPLFGKEIVINNVNPNGSLALIGQTRTYTSCIKLQAQELDLNGQKSEAKECVSPGLWPGYYSATLNLFYGQNGNNTKEITGYASFWYLPLWFIITVLLLVAIVAYLVWRLVRKVRGKAGKARPGKVAHRK